MPFAMNTLLEIDQSVLRPIVVDVVAQIKQQTGIPEAVPIYFPGPIGVVVPPGSELGSTDKENTALFENQKAIRIEVEQDFDLPDINNTPLYQCGSTPIFVDSVRGVTITPIYYNTDVVITFKYSTSSQSEAAKWRDDMRLRASQYGDINLHKLHYHYAIPGGHLVLLKNIFDLKQQIAGEPNQTLSDYFQKYFDSRLTLITDQVGQSQQYVIRETQTRVQGMYSFEAVPQKPSRDDTSGSWTIEFEYKLTFERPSVVRIDYPVMVHQQLIPMKYLTYIKDRSFDYNTDINEYSGIRDNLRYFERDAAVYTGQVPAINIPDYDVFTIPAPLGSTVTLMTVLCSISEDDKRTLFSLDDIGDMVFHEATAQYLKAKSWQYLCKPYRSAYTAFLYENNVMMPIGTLECDSSLLFTSTVDLDLTKVYRVVFAVNSDVAMLPPEAMEDLYAIPEAMDKYIQMCYSNIVLLTRTLSLPIKNRSDLNLVYWLMTGKTILPVPSVIRDNPTSIPGYITTSTNVSQDMKDTMTVATANLSRLSIQEALDEYGELNPASLMAARHQLVVSPRVMRDCIVVTKKQP